MAGKASRPYLGWQSSTYFSGVEAFRLTETASTKPWKDFAVQAVGIDPDGDVPDAADFIANPKKVVEAAGRFAVAAKDQFAVLAEIVLGKSGHDLRLCRFALQP